MSVQRQTRLRNAEEADFEAMVALNAATRCNAGPMDLPRLAVLHGLASHHKVAEVGNWLVGFVLAMRERTPYENDGYNWFCARYQRFVYVDCLVATPEFADGWISTELYRDLFVYARTCGLQVVACEYSIDPPNPSARALHDGLGFREVGLRRVHRGAAKVVSMQVAEP